MQRCLQAVQDFAPQFLEFVRNTNPSTIIEHGLFARSPEQVSSYADVGWGVGRVTLIGDAAHAMRPTGAFIEPTLVPLIVQAIVIDDSYCCQLL